MTRYTSHYVDRFSQAKTGFYQKIKEFKNFRAVLPARREDLKKEALDYRERTINNYRLKSEYYSNLLFYLISRHDITYDEKIVFLIEAVDENLNALTIYNKNVSHTMKEINSINDEEIKDELMIQHKEEIENYDTLLRQSIGFADRMLVQLERIYCRKYLGTVVKENEIDNPLNVRDDALTTDIKSDYSYFLLNEAKCIKPEDKLDDEQISNVKAYSLVYKSVYPNAKYKDVVYQLVNENNLLGLDNAMKKITFLIEVMDPELKGLTIFDLCSNWNEINKKLKESIGFHSKEFIEIEKIYYDIVKPNIDLAFKL